MQTELEVLQRSPYPRQYRYSIRNLNLPREEREGLMLIRQEQSQFRPNQPQIDTSDPRFDNLSQDSEEQEEDPIMPYSSIRNRVPTPNGRHYPERLHQSISEFESSIPKIW
jgi:hypothetical protein